MVVVRRWRPEDTRQIVALFHGTVHAINRGDYTQEQVDAWAPARIDQAAWAAQFAGRCTFVAEEDARIVGFADLESDGHIDRVYCHKDRQRMGIGTMLLVAIEDEARRGGLTRLSVEASITAQSFFERRGFRLIAEQAVVRRGVAFVNYRMEREMAPPK